MKLICAIVGILVAALQASGVVASPNEVFIYYANETNAIGPMQHNYDVLGGWLRSDPANQKANKIADQLAKDRADFPKHVLAERLAIEKSLAARSDVAVVLFTNERAARGEYESRRPGENSFAVKKMQIPQSDNYVLQSMPLSNPAVFAAVLERVATEFDPKEHRYTLVTKSHGNSSFAMVPRIAARNEMTSRDEILSIVSMTDGEARRAQPAWVNSVGVSKDEYFDTINRLGRDVGMVFDLVYLEACRSQEGLQGDVTLPQNIRALIAPKLKLDYRVVDYSSVFRDQTGSIAEALLRFLSGRFPEAVAMREVVPVWHRLGKAALYSLPLLGVVLLLIARRSRQRAVVPNQSRATPQA